MKWGFGVLNTIARTGKVLNLFTVETPEWGVTEIAGALGLAKSTTFDILDSLVRIGLLQQTSGDRYRLGWQLLTISRRLVRSSVFNVDTHRALVRLAQYLNATATIGAWDGQGVVCIASASPSRAPAGLSEGARLSGTNSALGRLLMAQLSSAAIEELIGRHSAAVITSNGRAASDRLRLQLEEAKLRDLASDDGEALVGHSCIAVGLRDRDSNVVAALSICMPSDRMRCRRDDYVRIARRTAQILSAERATTAAPPTAETSTPFDTE